MGKSQNWVQQKRGSTIAVPLEKTGLSEQDSAEPQPFLLNLANIKAFDDLYQTGYLAWKKREDAYIQARIKESERWHSWWKWLLPDFIYFRICK